MARSQQIDSSNRNNNKDRIIMKTRYEGTNKELPETWQKLEKLALTGRNAIKAYNGRHYRVGSIAKLSKRRITGSIVDYAFGVIQVPLALVMELPSHALGFQPAAESISPIGHESWYGIREMCKVAYDLVPPCSHLEALLSNTETAGNQPTRLQPRNTKITKQPPTAKIDKQTFNDQLCPPTIVKC